MASLFAAKIAFFVAVLLQGDERQYMPPGEPGYVYTVIAYGEKRGAAPTMAVRWGTWRRTARLPEDGARGVVLRLRHARWDAFPMTVSTSGRIVYGPVQGAPPPQWGDPAFRQVIW